MVKRSVWPRPVPPIYTCIGRVNETCSIFQPPAVSRVGGARICIYAHMYVYKLMARCCCAGRASECSQLLSLFWGRLSLWLYCMHACCRRLSHIQNKYIRAWRWRKAAVAPQLTANSLKCSWRERLVLFARISRRMKGLPQIWPHDSFHCSGWSFSTR